MGPVHLLVRERQGLVLAQKKVVTHVVVVVLTARGGLHSHSSPCPHIVQITNRRAHEPPELVRSAEGFEPPGEARVSGCVDELAPGAGANLALGEFVGARTRDEVDNRAQGLGAVEHGTGTADHLDTFHHVGIDLAVHVVSGHAPLAPETREGAAVHEGKEVAAGQAADHSVARGAGAVLDPGADLMLERVHGNREAHPGIGVAVD